MGAQKAAASGGQAPDRRGTGQSVPGQNSSHGSKQTLCLRLCESDRLWKVKAARHRQASISAGYRLSDFKATHLISLEAQFTPLKTRDNNNCLTGILQRVKDITCAGQLANRSAVQQNGKVIKLAEKSEFLLNQYRADVVGPGAQMPLENSHQMPQGSQPQKGSMFTGK